MKILLFNAWNNRTNMQKLNNEGQLKVGNSIGMTTGSGQSRTSIPSLVLGWAINSRPQTIRNLSKLGSYQTCLLFGLGISAAPDPILTLFDILQRKKKHDFKA